MITLLALIIYGFWLDDEGRTKFLVELNCSKFVTAFLGFILIFECIMEAIIFVIKLIFKKR